MILRSSSVYTYFAATIATGMCSIAVSPNRELISPGLSADRSNGDFLAPMSANSSDVKTLMRTMQPNPRKAESQIHSKFSTKSSTFVPRSSVQSSMIPSHDAAFIEKNIGVRRERAVQGVDSHANQLNKSSKTAPVHSEQSQHVFLSSLSEHYKYMHTILIYFSISYIHSLNYFYGASFLADGLPDSCKRRA